MLRKLRSDYYSKPIEENSGDMKRTWKILKQAMNKTVTIDKIVKSKTVTIDKIVSDNHEITDKALISEASMRTLVRLLRDLQSVWIHVIQIRRN